MEQEQRTGFLGFLGNGFPCTEFVCANTRLYAPSSFVYTLSMRLYASVRGVEPTPEFQRKAYRLLGNKVMASYRVFTRKNAFHRLIYAFLRV